MQSSNTRELVLKQLPNSPILRSNYELDRIMVNKGQIRREIREFLRCL